MKAKIDEGRDPNRLTTSALCREAARGRRLIRRLQHPEGVDTLSRPPSPWWSSLCFGFDRIILLFKLVGVNNAHFIFCIENANEVDFLSCARGLSIQSEPVYES